MTAHESRRFRGVPGRPLALGLMLLAAVLLLAAVSVEEPEGAIAASARAPAIPSFTRAATVTAGVNPISLTVADLNHDSKPDILTANSGASDVSVRLGVGDGSFADAATVTAAASPSRVAVGLFDADADPDLAVSCSTGNEVSIRLGQGDGSFVAGSSLAASNPYWVATGEFNRDGEVDLVSADVGVYKARVFSGAGTGAFTETTLCPVGGDSECVAAGDLDGDGDDDFATANWGPDTVSVWLSDGDGTFSQPDTGTIPVGFDPLGIAMGNLNGDAFLDLAVANQSSDTVSVLFGSGAGTFTAGPVLPVGDSPYRGIAIGDVNVDTTPDIVTANLLSDNISIWLGNGDGSFGSGGTLPTGDAPVGVAVADFDGNRGNDVAVLNNGPDNVTVLLNDVAGDFAAPVTTLTTTPPGPNGSDGWYLTLPSIALTRDEMGATYYQWDGTDPGAWQTYSTTLTAADGARTLHYFSADSWPNTETAQQRTFLVDTTNPTGTVVVDGGATYTDTLVATLDFSVEDTASGWKDFHTRESTVTWGSWEASAASVDPFGLAFGPDGTRTVEVEFRDVAGNVGAASDDIVLDTTAPDGSVVLQKGASSVTTRTVSLDSTVTDAFSGLASMRVGFGNGAGFGPWVACSSPTQSAVATLTTGDGIKTVQVQYRDALGNTRQLADQISYKRPRSTVYRPVVSPIIPTRYRIATFYGYVVPRVAGTTKFYLYRWNGRAYVKYRGPLSIRNYYVSGKNQSKWTYRIALPFRGKWYCYAYWPGDVNTQPGTSVRKYFTVR